jgi:hypothetical protein
VSDKITDYAKMLVLMDDIKKMQNEKRLLEAGFNVVIDELRQENSLLRMEVARLKNNVAYLDKKLDEELDK